MSGKNRDQLKVEWEHSSSGSRPVDHLTIIVKTCSKDPCLIDPDMPQTDEKATQLQKDQREFSQQVDSKFTVFSVLVCAENSLGRNCSFYQPKFEPTAGESRENDDMFVIWLVIVCVLLVLICCCIFPIIICLLCCCYKRDKERTYYPSKGIALIVVGRGKNCLCKTSHKICLESLK